VKVRMRVKRITGILLLLALTGCAPTVYIDYDQTAAFTQYKTFAWGKGTPARKPHIDRQIISAVEHQLVEKGFRKVDTNPDVLISYHAATTKELHYSTSSFGYEYGPAWGSRYGRYGGYLGMWGPGLVTETTTPVQVIKGTLVVDIYEADKKRLIWRGTGIDTVHDDPAAVESQIQEGIDKMFANFPPPIE
jgi:hypothetical protein